MRVILDTNVFISALLSPRGAPSRLVDAWVEGEFVLVSHERQLDELREVTRRDKVGVFIQTARAGRLVNRILALAEMPARLPPVERSRDPRDDYLLALCEAGEADWLVTGDKDDLLALKRHGRTRIGTAAELAEALDL